MKVEIIGNKKIFYCGQNNDTKKENENEKTKTENEKTEEIKNVSTKK